MKLPVVDMTISLTEIPDKVTVVFLIGNCHGKCPGVILNISVSRYLKTFG